MSSKQITLLSRKLSKVSLLNWAGVKYYSDFRLGGECYVTRVLEQARNESMARRELTIQSHALLVVRTLDSIYSALQRNPFDGFKLDALAAIMYLFDAMLYYADRERQPGMTRKVAELCLVGHLNEAYPGQEASDYAQVASKIFAAIKDPFRLSYYDFSQRTHSEEQIVRLVRYDQLSGSDDILVAD